MSRHSATKLSLNMQNGFTLIELIIVLAIAAILLLVATPNYNSVIIGSKVDKARYNLASSLAFARTEAVKRGEDISACLGSSGACGTSESGSTDWSSSGWHVRTSGEILRTVDSENEGVDISYDCGNFLSFNADGERNSATGSTRCVFKFADEGGDTAYDKCLYVNLLGRVRMADGSDAAC